MKKVAIVGYPNVGKTTLFNILTGGKNKIGNWEGVTVDISCAKMLFSNEIELYDLPGIKKIDDGTKDQEITRSFLDNNHIDIIINVLSADNLQRDLQLTLELIEKNIPFLVIILDQDNEIDQEKIKEKLACNAIAINLNEKGIIRIISKAINDAKIPKNPTKFTIKEIVKASKKQKIEVNKTKNWQDFSDIILMHRFFALPIFVVIMGVIFFITTTVGETLKDYFESAADIIFVQSVMHVFLKIGIHQNFLTNFYQYGIGSGITTVASFIPIISVLYFFLTIIEDSGYMVRISLIMDKFLLKIGLPGKAIIPLIMGFGCNVPAIIGTRIIEDKSQRIATMMLIPFMSCSARLAVYTLFVSVFFPNSPIIIFYLYIFSIFLAVIFAIVFRSALKISNKSSSISVVSLPRYSIPNFFKILKIVIHKLEHFVKDTGKLIIILSGALYIFAQIPFDITSHVKKSDSEFINPNSLLVKTGEIITPIFKPMGINEDNWPAVVCLMTGILAKEVVISTIVTLYDITDSGGETTAEKMRQHFTNEGSIFAYLLFVMIYFPCVSVFAVMKREASLKIALFSGIFNTVIGYIIAVSFFQLSQVMGDQIFLPLVTIIVGIIMIVYLYKLVIYPSINKLTT